MKPARFRFVPGPVGCEELVVNGHDVTSQVRAVSLLAVANEATQIRLELAPGVGVEAIEGEGVVEVVLPGDREAIVQFLANIDPDQLEKQMMDRSTVADSMVEVLLGILQEWARGAA